MSTDAMIDCRGCGKPGGDCAECSHSNWAIACGCGHHGDHLACDKRCSQYDGCKHPRGLSLAGTLEESERYSGEVPSRELVARALAEAREELERKYQKKHLKLLKLELSLGTYPA